MQGRTLLILLLGIVGICMTIFFNITRSSGDISANTNRAYRTYQAANIAQSAVNLGVRKLAEAPSWRSGIASIDMLGGKASITIGDSSDQGKPVVLVTGCGIVDQGTPDEHREYATAIVASEYAPFGLLGAVTSTHLIYPQGGFVLDGRNHNLDGSLAAPGTGVIAAWTIKNYTQSGGHVGGTANGIDYPPASPGNSAVIKKFQSWPSGNYPKSPDSLLTSLGLPIAEGTLKQIAQSGLNGSQYVTNPAALTHPLHGVTYVEMPSGGVWEGSPDISGDGILIVHNNQANSICNTPGPGTFKGLFIGDEIVHISTTVIGGVISMGGSEDDICNGSGKILYSRDALGLVAGPLVSTAGRGGTAVRVLAWKE
jgi:hypothetical protein